MLAFSLQECLFRGLDPAPPDRSAAEGCYREAGTLSSYVWAAVGEEMLRADKYQCSSDCEPTGLSVWGCTGRLNSGGNGLIQCRAVGAHHQRSPPQI
eukprot:5323925-Pyramimonas_sp.AAC.2